MTDRLTRFSRAAGAHVPDATAMAVFMLVALVAIALAFGNGARATADAFYRGLWMLLAFSMQMTLLLLLSSALSATVLFRNAVRRLARLPRSLTGFLLLSVSLTSGLSYLYWGIGLALGPLIAVHFARAAEERGIRIDFPLFLITQFAATAIWEFGFSSTPALMVATEGHFLQDRTGVMPLATTIGAPSAIAMSVAFPLGLVGLARFMMPREPRPVSAYPDSCALIEPVAAAAALPGTARGLAAWSERTRVLPGVLAAFLAGWLWHHFAVRGLGIDLNAMLTVLLLAVLVTQGTIAAFTESIRGAVQSVWQILVLYQVYGGIAGLLQYTNVGEAFAKFFAGISTPATFPLFTAIAGTAIGLFVPSSGGQWVIQGYVTTEAAAGVGVSAQQGLLALIVGDQLANLIAPFWILVAAAIARIDFRTIYGYALVYAALWLLLGVAIVTWLPAGG